MDNPLLPLGILSILLGPAYLRHPWLLVLAGGVLAAYFMAPGFSSVIHSFSIPAIVLVVAGYALMMLTSAVQNSDS